MVKDGTRLGGRMLLLGSLVLVVLASLGLVLASPLALPALDEAGDRDWGRLSEIGQTYGAVSALLSALALGGVVASLAIQHQSAQLDRQSAQLDREHAHRALHIELMRMAIEDPALQDCFGRFGDELSEQERRQWTYINQVVKHVEMSFEVGAEGEAWVRGSGYELFGSPISRRWWEYVRDRKFRSPVTPRRQTVFTILDDEWQAAAQREQERARATEAQLELSESASAGPQTGAGEPTD